jgi:DNA mismatch endonuclease (patch repair protein)
MMSGIRGKDTNPEIVVRKLLHSRGFRFRLHRKDLPGHPDIVLPKFGAAILVHGCFWHGHADCHLFRSPRSRTEFWAEKIASNRARDQKNLFRLHASGWRTLEIWECALKGKLRLSPEDLLDRIDFFIRSSMIESEISPTNQ